MGSWRRLESLKLRTTNHANGNRVLDTDVWCWASVLTPPALGRSPLIAGQDAARATQHETQITRLCLSWSVIVMKGRVRSHPVPRQEGHTRHPARNRYHLPHLLVARNSCQELSRISFCAPHSGGPSSSSLPVTESMFALERGVMFQN
jgi:hypothetical protein